MTRSDLIAKHASANSAAFRSALGDAYDSGYLDGYNAAKADIAKQIASALSIPSPGVALPSGGPMNIATSPVSHTLDDITSDSRAERGSIRPALLQFVTDNPGQTTKEIAASSGIKENSVRGGLNILRHQKKVIKDGEQWFLASPLGDAENPGGDTPGLFNKGS